MTERRCGNEKNRYDFGCDCVDRGCSYLAVIPASNGEDITDLEVSILKSVEEDGEDVLCAIEDEKELEDAYNYIMDLLYEEDEEG